jgi:NAD(P)-dependent dehydrogenase (short-subunit alcohol dehydrogenase family)
MEKKMLDLKGKVAIVTGAGSGIGLGIAIALARAGMAVALADIRARELDEAVRAVQACGAQALALEVDVSDLASVEAAAEATVRRFGKLHVAVNNAGVAMHGVPIEQLAPAEWDWVIGVNVYGVLHGIQAFLPYIRAHGEGGHVVNTASIGGFQIRPGWHTGAYSMTKYAVVALSEALEQDLQGSGIGVSVLCPAAVNTNIDRSASARPERLGGPFERSANHFIRDLVKDGLAPEDVGERLVLAILSNEFYVFTHSEPRQWVEERHARLLQAFDRAKAWEDGRRAQ